MTYWYPFRWHSALGGLHPSRETVEPVMRGGRARWKIENETFNTLKNQGDAFEHNYGSSVFPVVPTISWGIMRTRICGSQRDQGEAVETGVQG